MNCRAARDVFCRDPLRFDTNDSKMPEEPKRAFDALDNQHMYCVFPAPNSKELLQEDTRVVGDVVLKRGEFVMPKRTIPPPLKKEVFEEMMSIASESRKLVKSNPSQARHLLIQSRALHQGLMPQGRPSSAPHGTKGTHERSDPKRPHTALDEHKEVDHRITEVAALLQTNPEAVYDEGGIVSTSNDPNFDPVELLSIMDQARKLNRENGALPITYNTAAGVAPSSPAGRGSLGKVCAIKSGNHLKSVLTRTLGTVLPVVVLFGANWCKSYVEFLPKYTAVVAEFLDVSFFKVDADRLVEEAFNCLVSSVPTLQVYQSGKLLLNTASPDIPSLKQCLLKAKESSGSHTAG